MTGWDMEAGRAEFDRGNAESVLQVASFAADMEMLRPTPVSKVRNPDGSLQGETSAERTSRIVRTAVLHLLEQGLVVFSADIDQRLDRGIPMERQGRD
jgi:hypothetical protein